MCGGCKISKSTWKYSPSGKFAIHYGERDTHAPPIFVLLDFEEESCSVLPSKKPINYSFTVLFHWLSDSHIIYFTNYSLTSCKLIKKDYGWTWRYVATRKFPYDGTVLTKFAQYPLRLHDKDFFVAISHDHEQGTGSDMTIKLFPIDLGSSEVQIDLEILKMPEYFCIRDQYYRGGVLAFGSSIAISMELFGKNVEFYTVDLAGWNLNGRIVSHEYLTENSKTFEVHAPDGCSRTEGVYWQDERRFIVVWKQESRDDAKYMGVYNLLDNISHVFRVNCYYRNYEMSLHPSGIILKDYYEENDGIVKYEFYKVEYYLSHNGNVAKLSELALVAALLGTGGKPVFTPKLKQEDLGPGFSWADGEFCLTIQRKVKKSIYRKFLNLFEEEKPNRLFELI